MIRGARTLRLGPVQLMDRLEVRQKARKGVLSAALVLRNRWANDVLRRPGTGRLYRRGGVSHRASAPGEPPATDTGVLANSIDVEGLPNPVDPSARVGSGLAYARHLEFGVPGRIEPRPHATVALAEAEKDMNDAFRRAMR